MSRRAMVTGMWIVSILPLYLALLAPLLVFNVIPGGGNTQWADATLAALLSTTATVAGVVSVLTGVSLLRDPDGPRRRLWVFITATVVFDVAALAVAFSVAHVSY